MRVLKRGLAYCKPSWPKGNTVTSVGLIPNEVLGIPHHLSPSNVNLHQPPIIVLEPFIYRHL